MVDVYISAPAGTSKYDQALLSKYIRETMSPTPVNIKYWGDGSLYNPEFIKSADVLVIMGSKTTFHHSVDKLPVGVKREFSAHYTAGKKVLTSYFNSTKGWCVYDCQYEAPSSTIMGKVGSLNAVQDIFKKIYLTKVHTEFSKITSPLSESKNICVEITLPKEKTGPQCDVVQPRVYSLLLIC